MRYLPLTPSEEKKILNDCGVKNFSDLLDSVPPDLRLKGNLKTGAAQSEEELVETFENYASNIKAAKMISFLGQGAYDHTWPKVIDQLINRGEFLTAYTPYQPEISQGTLQSIFEFQSLIAEITGMEISNASLYDGSTALLEAILMSARLQKKEKGVILVSEGTYPSTLELLKTYLEPLNIQIHIWKADSKTYLSTENTLDYSDTQNILGVALQSPNKWGLIEDWAEAVKSAQKLKTKSIASTFQIHSLTEFASPGEAGIDIVSGEGQALGIPVGFGGPYLGLLCCKKSDVRQLPGRLVGLTEDSKGQRAFCITLSTREQHIRREKATSNICSNQNLMALRAAMYTTLMGPQGLLELSQTLRAKLEYFQKTLESKIKKGKIIQGSALNEISLIIGPLTEDQKKNFEKNSFNEGLICGVFNKEPIALNSNNQILTIAITERHSKNNLDKLADFLSRHF
jgi:glycine dehydrogenase subunit 1